MKTLIVIDYQVDFANPTRGRLYVPGGKYLDDKINDLSKQYDLVVLTQDWHIRDDPSFIAQGGPWPEHCVAGSYGTEFYGMVDAQDRAAAIFRKSENSALCGEAGKGFIAYLAGRGALELDLCGLALDYCVRETALDALKVGFKVNILADATLAVKTSETEKILVELERAGAVIL